MMSRGSTKAEKDVVISEALRDELRVRKAEDGLTYDEFLRRELGFEPELEE
jgi:hypothetical protein